MRRAFLFFAAFACTLRREFATCCKVAKGRGMMVELLRTNDILLIARIEALLDGVGIGHIVVDQHSSLIEGSIGIIPRRILILAEDLPAARRHVEAIGLGRELPRAAF
jgi:hypothetical protein